MKKRIFASISLIFTLLLAAFVTSSASAHGGEPRLEISAEKLSPGETLQVRGVEFEYDQEVTIALIGNQVEISLGTFIADAEGVFIQNIILPDTLAEGTYAVRARTYDHVVISPPITIWGAAITNDQDTGVRDQSDVQFGALPTFAASVVATTPVPQMPVKATRAITWSPTFLGIALLLALAAVFAFRLGKTRTEQ
jgi:hypothetical protein